MAVWTRNNSVLLAACLLLIVATLVDTNQKGKAEKKPKKKGGSSEKVFDGSNWNDAGMTAPKGKKNGHSGEKLDFDWNNYPGSIRSSKELKDKNGKNKKKGGSGESDWNDNSGANFDWLQNFSINGGSPYKTDVYLTDATHKPPMDTNDINQGNENHTFTVTFQTGYDKLQSNIQLIKFWVFHNEMTSQMFNFKINSAGSANGQKFSYNFTLPRNFGELSAFEVAPVSKSRTDGWQLEQVTISDTMANNQWIIYVGQYLASNSITDYDIYQINDQTRLSQSDDYLVAFQISEDSDMGVGDNIYFTVVNVRNETLPEFTVSSGVGGFKHGSTVSFQFTVLNSFGTIVGLHLRLEYPANIKHWPLSSISITNLTTGITTERKTANGSIQNGQYELWISTETSNGQMAMDGPDYNVIIATGNELDAGSVNSIIFTVFDGQTSQSKNYSFSPKGGKFTPGSNQSFFFTIPKEFGNFERFQIQVDTSSSNFNPDDNLNLDSATIINMQSGRQWTTPIRQYISTSKNDNDQVSTQEWNEVHTPSSIATTKEDIVDSPAQLITDDYTAIFTTGDGSDLGMDKTIYFSVINARNETSPEFQFKHKDGNLSSELIASYHFKILHSFGGIAGINLKFGNHLTKSQWNLKAVTIMNDKTGNSIETKIATGPIQEGYQYLVRLPTAAIQDGPDYEVIFQTGNKQDDGTKNSILFTAFDEQNVGSKNFTFTPKSGGFTPGAKQLFYFSVPNTFGNVQRFQIQIDTTSPNFNPDDDWELDSVTIINMQSGRQWTTPIGQYMFAKGDGNDRNSTPSSHGIRTPSSIITTEDVFDFPTSTDGTSILNVISPAQPNTDIYTVTFDNGDKSKPTLDDTIYFSVLNTRNETSPEFQFKRTDNSFRDGLNESYKFEVLHSFGDIAGFRVRIGNHSTESQWTLKSVTITSMTTGISTKTPIVKGSIQLGYQYIASFPPATTQDGPDYEVIFQTGNKPDDGTKNSILFTAFDEQNVSSKNFTFTPKSGGFTPGSNQSFKFSVPKSFGNVKSFQIAIDTSSSIFNAGDNWKLASITVVNAKSGRQWTKQIDQYMLGSGDNYNEVNTNGGGSQRSTIRPTIIRGKQSNLQVTYTCDGETKFTELEANDYLVTLQLGNLKDLGTNSTIYFTAINEKNESTNALKHTFANDGQISSKYVSFNVSVPHGFGPILKFVVSSVGNVQPITLYSVQIVNLVSGRKQIQTMVDNLIRNRANAYDIDAVTCDEPINDQQPTETNSNAPNEDTSVQVTFTCNGVTAFTEIDANDYRVTLQLGNVWPNAGQKMSINFAAINNGNQTTDTTKYVLNGQIGVASFNLSVPHGFGPILKFRVRAEGNIDPLKLNSIQIVNLVSGRKQIQTMGASLTRDTDYVFDIKPITCDPMAPPASTTQELI